MSYGRVVVALFCIFGIVVIASGAIFELLRFRRSDKVIGRRQFRLRMLSAVVWLALLALNLYAMTALWPPHGKTPAIHTMERHFLIAIFGGMVLLIIALILLALDLMQLSVARHRYELESQARLAAMARDEMARLTPKQ